MTLFNVSCIYGISILGEKLTDDEMEILMKGQENAQGEVNYEGKLSVRMKIPTFSHIESFPTPWRV